MKSETPNQSSDTELEWISSQIGEEGELLN